MGRNQLSLVLVGIAISCSAWANTTTKIEQVTIPDKIWGRVKVLKARPSDAKPTDRLPVIVILSGLQTGKDAVRLVETVPGVMAIAMDYPVRAKSSVEDMAVDVLTNSIRIQGQITTMLLWLKNQPDVNPDKINLLLVSFGTFISPRSIRIAEEFGFHAASTVFAFGGTEIKHFFEDDLMSIPPTEWSNKVERELNRVADQLDSARDLKHLDGPFLVIRGSQDTVIPEASGDALQDLLPEPKTVTVLDTDHIDTFKTDVIKQTMDVVLSWMKSIGSI